MARFKILSLDGGGTWCLLQALALDTIYGDVPGRTILRDFELVAANSGGSVVLAALVQDKTPATIVELFNSQQERDRIFSPLTIAEDWNNWNTWNHWGARYSAERKLAGLREVFADLDDLRLTSLPELVSDPTSAHRTHFLITAFDYDRLRATFFRSQVTSLAASSSARIDPTVVEAVHASTNAPIRYFDAPASIGNGTGAASPRRYWDGAFGGFNNPVFAAIIEALSLPGPRREIVALSIGSGSTLRPLTGTAVDPRLLEPRRDPAFFGDLEVATTVILDDPPDSATFMGHVVLGGRLPSSVGETVEDTQIVRLNAAVRPVKDASGSWNVPGWNDPQGEHLDVDGFVHVLTELELDVRRQEDVDLLNRVGKDWIAGHVPNQPIRQRWGDFGCEIGQPTFEGAAQRWNQIR
jgi:Patatin-like phospholipase